MHKSGGLHLFNGDVLGPGSDENEHKPAKQREAAVDFPHSFFFTK